MSSSPGTNSTPQRAPRAGWATLRGLAVLTVVLLAARIAVLAFLPLELAGDEAQYWDWSRTPALSYVTKGPGIAWAIALTTAWHLDEWTVRLPSVLAAAGAMLALARLAWLISGSRRAAAAAGIAFALLPAFAVTAVFATIDALYLFFWTIAALLAWGVLGSWRTGRGSPAQAIALGVALGLGVLVKFTILLLIPGLIAFAMLDRRAMRARARAILSDTTLACAAFAVCIAPLVLWNMQHSWPSLRHLLGHLHVAGGDLQAHAAPGYSPMWTLEFLAFQLAVAGPMLAVVILAIGRRLRRGLDAGDRFAIACAVPIFVFYLGATAFSPSEANWPIAGYVTLLIPAARVVPGALRLRGRRLNAWLAHAEPRPRAGVLRRSPESAMQIAWHWAVGFGVGAMLIPLIVPAALPVLGRIPAFDDNAMLRRVTQSRDLAARVYAASLIVRQRTGEPPAIIADRYYRSASLAFYLPGRPSVACASAWMGDRATAYDYFDRTRLDRQTIEGRAALLVGSSAESWERAFGIEITETLSAFGPIHFTDEFRATPTPLPGGAPNAHRIREDGERDD